MKFSRLALFALVAGAALAPLPAAAQSGCPSIIDRAILTAAQWNACFAAKQDTNTPGAPLPVAKGGTGLNAGVSGGVPYYPSSSTMGASGVLGAGQVVIGGGAGQPPHSVGPGTAVQVLHGGASPAYGAVNLATDTTGTAGTGSLPTGKSVVASNSVLEAVAPVQISTAASKVFAAADLQYETRRSNAGSAMTDTLPAAAAAGMVNGARIIISNVDATGTDTVTAGASTTIDGASSIAIPAGRAIALSFDQPSGIWRVQFNTATAVIGPVSSASGNVLSFADTTGKVAVDSGKAAANVVTASGTLTSNALILGAGTKAQTALGSLGTTTTVLHGNAAGAPTFGAVANADLVNSATTVNGQTCTLGATCTIAVGINGSPGTVTAAATTDLSTSSNTVQTVSGSTAITSFGTGANLYRILNFTGSPLITFNATTLKTPKGASIQACPNDSAVLISDAAGNWSVASYTPYGGDFAANGTGQGLGTSPTNMTSVVIPCGKWTFSGIVQENGSGAPSNEIIVGGWSSTSASYTGTVNGKTRVYGSNAFTGAGTPVGSGTIAPFDVTFSSSTTYYFVMNVRTNPDLVDWSARAVRSY